MQGLYYEIVKALHYKIVKALRYEIMKALRYEIMKALRYWDSDAVMAYRVLRGRFPHVRTTLK
ncbi:MAG: hypothetical protein ACE5R6_17975 [Candidatus Heimdallarchaeota archaeon]